MCSVTYLLTLCARVLSRARPRGFSARGRARSVGERMLAPLSTSADLRGCLCAWCLCDISDAVKMTGRHLIVLGHLIFAASLLCLCTPHSAPPGGVDGGGRAVCAGERAGVLKPLIRPFVSVSLRASAPPGGVDGGGRAVCAGERTGVHGDLRQDGVPRGGGVHRHRPQDLREDRAGRL
eukprot:1184695-Prorocentrum_minimum.AAC.2